MPQNTFFTQIRNLVSQKTMQRLLFFHPPFPFPIIFATATVVAFVLLHNSRFNFHCYTERKATPTQKSARKWRCDLSQLFAWKITKRIHLCKPASSNHPIHNNLHELSDIRGAGEGSDIDQVTKTTARMDLNPQYYLNPASTAKPKCLFMPRVLLHLGFCFAVQPGVQVLAGNSVLPLWCRFPTPVNRHA